MAPNLKQAAKARANSRKPRGSNASKAAKEVASKLAGGGKKNGGKSPANTPASTPSTPTIAVASEGSVAVNVPGLPDIHPDKLSGMMPTFDSNAYQISDPLNPPESIPQVTQADFDKRMGIYEGAQRALKLTGAAFDTTRERFVVIGKQAKAFGAGIQAATEVEKTKGNYIDYLNQVEITNQKGIVLDISQYKTTSERSKSVHVKTEINEGVEQARIRAEKAQEETKQKQSQLEEFRQQLGQYLPSKKAS